MVRKTQDGGVMPIDFTGFAFPKGMPQSGERVIKKRQIKAAESKIRKQVIARDQHRCFFPGCKVKAVEKHHQVYRSKGGAFTPTNLVSGCSLHHRWVHDGLIRLHGNPENPPLRVVLTALGRDAKIHIQRKSETQ